MYCQTYLHNHVAINRQGQRHNNVCHHYQKWKACDLHVIVEHRQFAVGVDEESVTLAWVVHVMYSRGNQSRNLIDWLKYCLQKIKQS